MIRSTLSLFIAASFALAGPAFASDRVFFCAANNDVKSRNTAAIQIRFCEQTSYNCGSWIKRSVQHGGTELFISPNRSGRYVEIEAQSGGLTNNSPQSARTSRRAATASNRYFAASSVGLLCQQGKVKYCGSYFVDGSNQC